MDVMCMIRILAIVAQEMIRTFSRRSCAAHAVVVKNCVQTRQPSRMTTAMLAHLGIKKIARLLEEGVTGTAVRSYKRCETIALSLVASAKMFVVMLGTTTRSTVGAGSIQLHASDAMVRRVAGRHMLSLALHAQPRGTDLWLTETPAKLIGAPTHHSGKMQKDTPALAGKVMIAIIATQFLVGTTSIPTLKSMMCESIAQSPAASAQQKGTAVKDITPPSKLRQTKNCATSVMAQLPDGALRSVSTLLAHANLVPLGRWWTKAVTIAKPPRRRPLSPRLLPQRRPLPRRA